MMKNLFISDLDKNNVNHFTSDFGLLLRKKIDESYIFVCNHTCSEDIETILDVLDRNAYLVLASIESLKYNFEMYLSFINGMIPFDILDASQRKSIWTIKMLKTVCEIIG